jgi:dTDP-4-dehydrorhamnose reductase
MRILLTGAAGQLGRELAPRLRGLGHLFAPSRKELDLEMLAAIRPSVDRFAPDLIVNAAADTDVDSAEQHPDRAFLVNAQAVAELAEAAARANAPFIHISTDYVFDGKSDRPYRPDDSPRPVNVYGRSKLDGELAIREIGPDALIIRTSWLVSDHRRNFALAMLERAGRTEPLRVVNDQYGLPTTAHVLADAIVHVVRRRMIDEQRPSASAVETLHIGQGPPATWYRLAQAVLDSVPDAPPLVPIHSGEYPAVARRPRYSVLDCADVVERYGVQLPHWRESVREVVDRARGRTSPLQSIA